MQAVAPRRLYGLRGDVELVCWRFAQTVAFYRDCLGLPVVCQWAGVVRLDGGQGRWLTLWRADPAYMSPEDVRWGWHSPISFVVGDLDAVCTALRAAGLDLASHPQADSPAMTLNDPEGRAVTLLEPSATPCRARERAGIRTLMPEDDVSALASAR